MKPILAIDPGPEKSAWVLYDGTRPIAFAKDGNDELLCKIRCRADVAWDELVIEQIAAMGMAVGAEVFETVFWSGRFIEANGGPWNRVKRHEVKMHLCGNTRAKDANIRTALLDRFGPGKEKAVGTKKHPGPLYGIAGDCWAALAVAVTYWDNAREPQP